MRRAAFRRAVRASALRPDAHAEKGLMAIHIACRAAGMAPPREHWDSDATPLEGKEEEDDDRDSGEQEGDTSG